MEIGSIVAIKNFPINPEVGSWAKWIPTCDERTPYVIRDIVINPADGIELCMFEEGVIGYNPHLNKELGIGKNHLIELLPPEEQINLQELINVQELTV